MNTANQLHQAVAPETNIHPDLHAYLTDWDAQYLKRAQEIDLFNPDLTKQWTELQQRLFTGFLYHQRAHFDAVLWLMGSFAENDAVKKIILANTQDEFGSHAFSHEQLYLMFAQSLGLDLRLEIEQENYFLPFLRTYNKTLTHQLRTLEPKERLVVFSAVERLDNVDYSLLRGVATSFGTQKRALTFFNVHIHVNHHEITHDLLQESWLQNPERVKALYQWVTEFQIPMWGKISNAVFHGQFA